MKVKLFFILILIFLIHNISTGQSGVKFEKFDVKDEFKENLVFGVVMQTAAITTALGENTDDLFIDVNKIWSFYKNNQDKQIEIFKKNNIDIWGFFRGLNYNLKALPSVAKEINLKTYIYKEKKYICVNKIGPVDIFNDLRMTTNEQCSRIISDYAIDVLKQMHKYFQKLIDGYILTINWASKDFSDSYPMVKNHILCLISSKSDLEKLINYDITIQQFLDKILILNKNGISESENRINIKIE